MYYKFLHKTHRNFLIASYKKLCQVYFNSQKASLQKLCWACSNN